MFTNQVFFDGIEQNDFAVDTRGMFKLQTWDDLKIFTLHAVLMVTVTFLFAVTFTLF